MSRAETPAARVRRLLRRPGFPRRLLGVELVAGGLLLARGIEVARDSASYLDGAAFRAPLYPLLLDALELVFGRHALGALLVVQVALGLAAVGALVLHLRRALALPEWLAWTAVVLLLGVPYLGPLAVANRVLSEAIAYPLFLLVVRALLAAMLERRLDRFAAAAAWTAALLLSRQQFVFLLPVLTLCALLWMIDPAGRRRAVLALGLVVALTAGVELADRSVRLARHGRFARSPFVGLQLVAGGLYVAPPSAADRLPAGQRELFLALHDAASQRGLTAEHNPSPGGVASYAWHYRQEYNQIVWGLVAPELRRRAGGEGGSEEWFAVEELLLPLARSLILAEPARFARLYVSNLLSGLGISYAVLLTLVALLCLVRVPRRAAGAEIAAALVVGLHLANCALVALVEPLKMRYSFYTDALAVLVVLALVARGVGGGPGSPASAPADLPPGAPSRPAHSG